MKKRFTQVVVRRVSIAVTLSGLFAPLLPAPTTLADDNNQVAFMSIDLSGFQIDPTFKSKDYPKWYLGFYNVGHSSSEGVGIAVTKLPPGGGGHTGFFQTSLAPAQATDVGLTTQYDVSPYPNPTPSSCKVSWVGGAPFSPPYPCYVLKISGTLYAPEGSQSPAIKNLSCALVSIGLCHSGSSATSNSLSFLISKSGIPGIQG